MAIRDKDYLKNKFKTGDIPTGQDFADFIDTLISQVDGKTPNQEGNVETDYKIIENIPADHPPSDYPEGLSEFYADYDPANYVDYIASHPDMEQLEKGKLCIRTFRGEDFAFQQVDNVKNGVFQSAFVRLGTEGDDWGPLTPTDNIDRTVVEEIAQDIVDIHAERKADNLILGHVLIDGTTLSIENDGVINVNYDDATIKLNNDNKLHVSISHDYTLDDPEIALSTEGAADLKGHLETELTTHSELKASTTVLGHVKVDGTTIVVDEYGKISSPQSPAEQRVNFDNDLLPSTDIADIQQGITISKFFSANASTARDAWLSEVNTVFNWGANRSHIGMEVTTVRSGNDIEETVDVYMLSNNPGEHVATMKRIYQNATWRDWKKHQIVRVGLGIPNNPDTSKTLYGMFGMAYYDLQNNQLYRIEVAQATTPTAIMWVRAANGVELKNTDYDPYNSNDGLEVTYHAEAIADFFHDHKTAIASVTELGHVMVDGQTISVDEEGYISAKKAYHLNEEVSVDASWETFEDGTHVTTFDLADGESPWIALINSELSYSLNGIFYMKVTTIKDTEKETIEQTLNLYISPSGPDWQGTPLLTAFRVGVFDSNHISHISWSGMRNAHTVQRSENNPDNNMYGIKGNLFINTVTGKMFVNTGSNLNKNRWEPIVKVDNSSLVMDDFGVISVAPSLGGPGAEPPMKEIIYDEIVNDEFWDTGIFVLRADDNNEFDLGQEELSLMPQQQDFIVDLTYDQYYDADLEALVKLKHVEIAPLEGPIANYWRGIVKLVKYDDDDIEPGYSFNGMYPVSKTTEIINTLLSTRTDAALSANMGRQLFNTVTTNNSTFNTHRTAKAGKYDDAMPALGHVIVDNETIEIDNDGVISVDPVALISEDTEGIRVEEGKIIMDTGTGSVKGITYLSSNPLHEGIDSAPTSTLFKGLYEQVEDLEEAANDFAPVDDGNGNLNISPGHVYVDGTTITIDDGVISALVTDNAWVFSATEPTSASMNQVYFNTSTKKLYQYDGTNWLEKGDLSSGAKGDTGEQGQPGDTVQWHFGSGTPNNSLGKNGDLYIKEEDGQVYKKVSDAYVDQEYSLTGPQGEQGEQGDAFTYSDFTPAQLEALKVKGDKGENGDHYLITKHFDNYVDLEAHTFPIPMNAIQFYAIVNEDDPMHGNVYAVQYDDVLEEHTIEFVHNLQDANTLKGEQGPRGEKGDQGDMPELANNLTTTDVEKGLAAPQGKVLKEALDTHKDVKATKTAHGHVTVGDGLNVTDGVVSAPAKGYFYGTYNNTSASPNNNYFPHAVVYSSIQHTPGGGGTGHVTLTCGKAYRVTLSGRIEFSGSGSEAGFAIYDKTGGATVSQSHGHWGSLNYATAKAMPNNLDFILLVPDHPSGTRNYTIRCTGTVSGNPPYFAQWGEIRLLVQEI